MRRRTDSSPQTVTAHTSGPRVCTTLPTLDAQYVTPDPWETWWGLWGGALMGEKSAQYWPLPYMKWMLGPAVRAAPRVDGARHPSGEGKELLGDTLTHLCLERGLLAANRKSKNVQVFSLCSDGCLGFLDVSCFVCIPPHSHTPEELRREPVARFSLLYPKCWRPH